MRGRLPWVEMLTPESAPLVRSGLLWPRHADVNLLTSASIGNWSARPYKFRNSACAAADRADPAHWAQHCLAWVRRGGGTPFCETLWSADPAIEA